jgi:hypothetical protein
MAGGTLNVLDVKRPTPYTGGMPKNPTTEILRRWRDMDLQLRSSYGLVIPRFARQWKVSEKTVRRDLAAFKELGLELVQDVREGEIHPMWHYARGHGPLFHRAPLIPSPPPT